MNTLCGIILNYVCISTHLIVLLLQINCQEVIYLFSRKTFLFTRSWDQFSLITWLIVLTVKELKENLMAICNNYQILCLGNIFQIIRNCQFYLNIDHEYKSAFVVILNGSHFSTYPSPVLKLLLYSHYFFCLSFTLIYCSIFYYILIVYVFQNYYHQCWTCLEFLHGDLMIMMPQKI